MSGQVTETQIKRWALDASDWLWGTAQGAFNEKQTTSEIVVDAVIGVIPLVGDATAARDIIAVSTRLAQDRETGSGNRVRHDCWLDDGSATQNHTWCGTSAYPQAGAIGFWHAAELDYSNPMHS